MELKIVTAGEIKVGDKLPEADGFLFEVIEVNRKTEKTVEIFLASDHSSFRSHHKCNGGVKQTYRSTTQLYIAA